MIRACVSAALVLVAMLAVTLPAAADPRIGLSTNGSSWAATLPAALFDSEARWVPGDSRTATFYVRNQSGDLADLSVEVMGSTVDSLLETGDLSIVARGIGGHWQQVSRPGTHELFARSDVAADESQRVDVTVALAAGSSEASKSRRLALDLRVRLSQSTADLAPRDGNSILPGTGGPALLSVILGLGFAAGGTILASRRREEEDSHV